MTNSAHLIEQDAPDVYKAFLAQFKHNLCRWPLLNNTLEPNTETPVPSLANRRRIMGPLADQDKDLSIWAI